MALIFVESFDGPATYAQLTGSGGRWSNLGGTAVLALGASRTSNGLTITADGNRNGGIFKQFGSTYTDMIVGFAYKAAVTNNTQIIFQFLSGGHSGLGQTVGSLTRINQTLVGKDVSAGTVTRFTSANVITSTSAYYYIEFHFKLANSGGIIEARVDGTVVGTFTGDTEGALTFFDTIQIGETDSNQQTGNEWDDFYALDTTGSLNTNYLGPCHIRCIRPSANGNSSQYVGSDGNSTDNYLLVNEQSVNDSNFVTSTADGDKDTYVYDDIGALTGTVAGVQVTARSAFLNAGTPKHTDVVARLSGTESTVTLVPTLDITMKEREAIFETKPGGGGWSLADINNAEFGYKQTT